MAGLTEPRSDQALDARDDSFWLFYGLWSLNGRNSVSSIYYGSVFKGVLVFVITKTKRGLCFRNYEN